MKNKIIETLSDYFLNIRRRDIIPRSDLIGIIENIDGVDTVNVFLYLRIMKKYHSNFDSFTYDSTKNIGLTDDNDILINDYDDLGNINKKHDYVKRWLV